MSKLKKTERWRKRTSAALSHFHSPQRSKEKKNSKKKRKKNRKKKDKKEEKSRKENESQEAKWKSKLTAGERNNQT